MSRSYCTIISTIKINENTKTIEVYRRDKKNSKKTYNIEFVAEYNVSEISISELKNIINRNKDDENVFLTYTLYIPQIK